MRDWSVPQASSTGCHTYMLRSKKGQQCRRIERLDAQCLDVDTDLVLPVEIWNRFYLVVTAASRPSIV
jgi:hypothetical protein